MPGPFATLHETSALPAATAIAAPFEPDARSISRALLRTELGNRARRHSHGAQLDRRVWVVRDGAAALEYARDDIARADRDGDGDAACRRDSRRPCGREDSRVVEKDVRLDDGWHLSNHEPARTAPRRSAVLSPRGISKLRSEQRALACRLGQRVDRDALRRPLDTEGHQSFAAVRRCGLGQASPHRRIAGLVPRLVESSRPRLPLVPAGADEQGNTVFGAHDERFFGVLLMTETRGLAVESREIGVHVHPANDGESPVAHRS